MIYRMIRKFYRNQQGFLLIEVLGALAIAGLIGIAVTVANVQVLNQTSSNNNYTTASRNTLNALHWISRDVQMAQSINGSTGFPSTEELKLEWMAWDNTLNTVNYTVVDGELIRKFSIDTSPPSETVIASFISTDSNMTYCSSDNGVLTISITASVGEGRSTVNVTKKHEITSRPNL